MARLPLSGSHVIERCLSFQKWQRGRKHDSAFQIIFHKFSKINWVIDFESKYSDWQSRDQSYMMAKATQSPALLYAVALSFLIAAACIAPPNDSFDKVIWHVFRLNAPIFEIRSMKIVLEIYCTSTFACSQGGMDLLFCSTLADQLPCHEATGTWVHVCKASVSVSCELLYKSSNCH